MTRILRGLSHLHGDGFTPEQKAARARAAAEREAGPPPRPVVTVTVVGPKKRPVTPANPKPSKPHGLVLSADEVAVLAEMLDEMPVTR